MARSTYVYNLILDSKVIGSFTVKKELIIAVERGAPGLGLVTTVERARDGRIESPFAITFKEFSEGKVIR